MTARSVVGAACVSRVLKDVAALGTEAVCRSASEAACHLGAGAARWRRRKPSHFGVARRLPHGCPMPPSARDPAVSCCAMIGGRPSCGAGAARRLGT
ncbi:hypothetical protein COLSTE_00367 [Collinsella stercoris DSM 13279]|uniref:Uncharacterized protein n=1 Tax=Collinsella stercoris DSM 13279 TaxID=445975 RepID=B6G8H6_9ACTN|nr:hypothetical protein COLSTE_00367 [Collinsella stercoris DSM 13279]